MEKGPGDKSGDAAKAEPVSNSRVGEIVFVWHDRMLFEARIDQEQIFVSEDGLKCSSSFTVTLQTWDAIVVKTVRLEEIVVYDDTSVRYVHNLMRKHANDGRPLALRPLPLPIVRGLGMDRQSDETHEIQTKLPPSTGGNQAKFQFAPVLQMLILEDWEKVTKEYHLISLPCIVTVRDILQKWGNRRKMMDTEKGGEFCDLLLHYFDVSLPKMLLYRFEVLQYVERLDAANGKPKSSPSYNYGGFHLLRFLIKLPFVLESLEAPKTHISHLSSTVNDLSNYLVRNGRFIFSQMHQPASHAYINRVALFTSGHDES